MEPAHFREENFKLTKPADMTDEECGGLPIFRHEHGLVSCWRPSLRERFSFVFFGRVWVHVRTNASTQPPIALLAIRRFFLKRPSDTKPRG